MCDRHSFQFDVDKAYEDQLACALEDSPEHPLQEPEAASTPGVYVLYWNGVAVYVGQARNLRARLRARLKKVVDREGVAVEEVSCRYLVIARLWEVARAKAILIRKYKPEWNGISGSGVRASGHIGTS